MILEHNMRKIKSRKDVKESEAAASSIHLQTVKDEKESDDNEANTSFVESKVSEAFKEGFCDGSLDGELLVTYTEGSFEEDNVVGAVLGDTVGFIVGG